jgi:hypothetical protein
MNARIASSSCHSVRVQNAKFASDQKGDRKIPQRRLGLPRRVQGVEREGRK